MWRRFARFLGRISTLFVSLLIFVATPQDLLAQEGAKGDAVQVTFLNQRREDATVYSWSEDGIRLKLDGVTSPVYFSWTQLDPGCSLELRQKFLGKDETLQLEDMVTGFQLIPRNGVDFLPVPRIGLVVGMEIPSADPALLKLKSRSQIWIFLREDLLYIKRVKVNRSNFLTESEKENEVLNRVRPGDASGWDEVGRELERLGLKDLAINAFRRAEILRRPDLPEGRLYGELAHLRKTLEASGLQIQVLRAQEFFLSGKIEPALEILQIVAQAAQAPPLRARILQVSREIRSWWMSSMEEKLVQEWGRIMDSLIRMKVADRSVSLEEAVTYVGKNLMSDTGKLIRLRFQFSEGDPTPRKLWEDRSVSNVRKHSYGEGSWIRVRPELGNPEPWWKSAEDPARVAYLKGLSIEQNYQVLWAGEKNCSLCGGAGSILGTGSRRKICGACRGLKSEKVVFSPRRLRPPQD